jgi:hypothetical protein
MAFIRRVYKRDNRKNNPIDVLKSLHERGFIPDDQIKKLDASPRDVVQNRSEPTEYEILVYNMVELSNWLNGMITDEMRETHKRIRERNRQISR